MARPGGLVLPGRADSRPAMWRWLLTAIDTYLLHPLKGNGYQFWSGIAGEFGALGLLAAVYRKHVCHVHRCPRLAWHPHPAHGHPVCKRHFPDGCIPVSKKS